MSVKKAIRPDEEKLSSRRGKNNPAQDATAIPQPVASQKADPFEAALEEATEFILRQIENPVDVWAVAATLESRGQRDIDAIEKYGKTDIFDLAADIYARCRRHLYLEEIASLVLAQKVDISNDQTVLNFLQQRGLSDKEAVVNFRQPNLANLTLEVQARCQKRLQQADSSEPVSLGLTWPQKLWRRLQRILMSAPALLATILVLFLGYAWWVYSYAGQPAIAVAWGAILSVIVTGGFIQAGHHLGGYYSSQGHQLLAAEICTRLLMKGLLALAIAGAGVGFLTLLFNYFSPIFAENMLLSGLIYALLMGTIWLFLTIFQILRPKKAIIMVIGGVIITLIIMIWLPQLQWLHWLALSLTGAIAYWQQQQQKVAPADEIAYELKSVQLPVSRFWTYLGTPYLVIAFIYLVYLLLIYLTVPGIARQAFPLVPFPIAATSDWLKPLFIWLVIICIFSIISTIILLEYAIFETRPRLARDAPERLGRFIKFYGRGISFATPMMLQVFTVLLFGFGLWASLDFNEEAATAVAVGTILSFLVTGGFVQAIGRLGLFYTEQQSYLLAREAIYRLIRVGLATVMAVSLIWYVSNLLIPLFPQRVILISLVYYLLLATLWLLLAVLYTLQKRAAVVIITVIGLIVIGWVLFTSITGLAGWVTVWSPWLVERLLAWLPAARETIIEVMQSIIYLVDFLGLTNPYRGIPWNTYAAQWIGLTVAILLTFLWGHRKLFEAVYWLKQQETGHIGSLKLARLPRPSIVTFSVSPYFAYGLLYFGYLFTDRLIGWTTADQPLPLFIWFRTPYELGLDWALLSLLLIIAMLEYTINEFGLIILHEQKARKAIHIEFLAKSDKDKAAQELSTGQEMTHPLDRVQESPHPLNNNFIIKTSRQIKAHNRFFIKFYIRQLILFGAIVTLSIVVTYFGILWFRQFDNIKRIRDFFADPVTFYVFYWGVIGYSLLVFSMLNSVFFFFLSRPQYTLQAIGLGLLINIGVGFILSRMFVYWYSVIGMTLGAGVIAAMTTWYAFRVLRRLDYYYYSAY